jgi:antitoxin CptB
MDEARRIRINRLKWHCRRALLELDLVFARFWERHEGDLGQADEAVLEDLLALEDHDLWALVSGRTMAAGDEQAAMVARLRELAPKAGA